MPTLFGGGNSVQPPQQDLLKLLLSAYQGQADTAGAYNNLNAIFGPAAGQTGLTEQQQQMFGYNVGPGGGIGSPATPPGGFFGAPQSTSTSGYTTGIGSGDGGNQGVSFPGTTGGTGSSIQAYEPGSSTRIGNGNTFNDPYANTPGPGMAPGYHPGTLDLNATALNSYGPVTTGALLNANPFLSDALGLQDVNAFGASSLADSAGAGQSPLLGLLNQQAYGGLQSNGALSPQEQRDLSQQSLSSLAQAGNTHGNSAVALDLLSRDSAVRQRQQQAQALASGVQGLNNQTNQTQGGLYQIAGNLGSQFANSSTAGVTNPLLQILGLGSLNATSNPSSAISDQAAMTNPFLTLGTDVANANFNSQSAANIANANNASATNAGYLQLLSSLLSSSGGYGG